MIRDNKPKPHYTCFICLRKLGFGYDRTAKLFNVAKKSVYTWFSRRNIHVDRPPQIRHPKHRPKIDFNERWKNRSQRQLATYFTAVLWTFTKHGKYIKRGEGLVGCCRQQFLNHLSTQFHSGMAFENYGALWQIDHRIPQCAYDLRDPAQRQMCYYYSNLQPLLRHDHARKSIDCPLPVFIPANDNRVNPAKLRFPIGQQIPPKDPQILLLLTG